MLRSPCHKPLSAKVNVAVRQFSALSALCGSPRPDRQGMDVGVHQAADRGVYRAMPRDRAQTGKRRADHVDPEMSATVLRTGMAGVPVTFVFDLQRGRGQ